MRINFSVIRYSIFLLVLHGCSATTTPAVIYNNDAHMNALDEASYDISRALVDLSATAQAAHPYSISPPADPASYGMEMLASVDWSGPVAPLLMQMAKAANYRVRILGNEPNIPIIVTVNARNQVLGDILRNVGYQCAKRAAIVVFPDSKVLELRYAKN